MVRSTTAHGLRSAVLAAAALAVARGAAAQSPATRLPNGCYHRASNDTLSNALPDSGIARSWTAAMRTNIDRHDICIGMTVDMIRKSWGKPPRMRLIIPTTPADTTTQMYYRGATVIAINSVVRAIRPPSSPSRLP